MKRLLNMGMVIAVAAAMAGCATSGDLAKVQSQERLIDAKADQALREAQAAKAAADAAKLQSDDAKVQSDAAAVRAENAEKKAQEREKMAAEKERMADRLFQQSMRK